MFKFTISGAKPPKSKNSFLLSTSVVSDSQGVQDCRRLTANIIGINEEKQFEALSFLLDNLEGDLYLGTQREFSQRSKISRKPVTQMLSTLSSYGLIDVQHGYIRVSKDLPKLFNRFDGEGNVQLTLDINMLPNQTSLDLD